MSEEDEILTMKGNPMHAASALQDTCNIAPSTPMNASPPAPSRTLPMLKYEGPLMKKGGGVNNRPFTRRNWKVRHFELVEVDKTPFLKFYAPSADKSYSSATSLKEFDLTHATMHEGDETANAKYENAKYGDREGDYTIYFTIDSVSQTKPCEASRKSLELLAKDKQTMQAWMENLKDLGVALGTPGGGGAKKLQYHSILEGAARPAAGIEASEASDRVEGLSTFAEHASREPQRVRLESALIDLRLKFVGPMLCAQDGTTIADAKDNPADLVKIVVGLIEVLKLLVPRPTLYQPALAASALAHEAMIILAARVGEKMKESEREELKQTAADLRKILKDSTRALSKTPSVSPSALKLHSVCLELAVNALPDTDETMKAVKLGFSVFKDVASSVATGTLSTNLFDDLASAAELGGQHFRRVHAAATAKIIRDLITFAATLRQSPNILKGANEAKISDIKKDVLYHYQNSIHGPIKRWELRACFSSFLTEALISLASDDVEDDDASTPKQQKNESKDQQLITWLWEGEAGAEEDENKFGGLAEQITCGNESEDQIISYDLFLWAGECQTMDLSTWLQKCLEIFKDYCKTQCLAKVRRIVGSLEKGGAKVIEKLEHISKHFQQPVPVIERGILILNKFASLDIFSSLKAMLLQSMTYPLRLLKHFPSTKFEPGQKCEARFGGKSEYYGGTIVKSNGDGTYEVKYDDGDSEERVAVALIRSSSGWLIRNFEGWFDSKIEIFMRGSEAAGPGGISAATVALQNFKEIVSTLYTDLTTIASNSNFGRLNVAGALCVAEGFVTQEQWETIEEKIFGKESEPGIIGELSEMTAKLGKLNEDLSAVGSVSSANALKTLIVKILQDLKLEEIIDKKVEALSEAAMKLADHFSSMIKEQLEAKKQWYTEYLTEFMAVQDVVGQVSSLLGTVLHHFKMTFEKIDQIVQELKEIVQKDKTVPTKVDETHLKELSELISSATTLLNMQLDFQQLQDCDDCLDKIKSDAKKVLKEAMQDLTDAAHEAMQDLTEALNDAVGSSFDMDDFDAAEGLLDVVGDTVGDLMADKQAEKETWRARAVSILGARRLAAAVSDASLRSRIHATLARQQVAESNQECRAVFEADQGLPMGLNDVLSIQPRTQPIVVKKPDEFNADVTEAQRYMMQQMEAMDIQQKQLLKQMGADSADKSDAKVTLEKEGDAASRDAWLQTEADVQADVQDRLREAASLADEAEREGNPVKKQRILLRCHKLHRQLQASAHTTKKISTKHGVEVDFLPGMHKELSNMSGKLDTLQEGLKATREDLKRLAGRPVLEVYEEWKTRLLSRAKRLPENVYIESEVAEIKSRPPSQDMPKTPVTRAFRNFMIGAPATVVEITVESKVESKVTVEFDSGGVPDDFPPGFVSQATSNQVTVPLYMIHLTDNSSKKSLKKDAKVTVDWKNVCLLSGQAGGGKTTAVDKLTVYILDEYSRKRKQEDGVTVVLLPVNLPKLKSPLDSIFEEGCQHAFGGALRESQIKELIDKVQAKNSKVEVVFLLDGYDELPNEARKRNLWRTNNLERFRDKFQANENLPKVLFSSRSELFSGLSCKDYHRWFIPFESQTDSKNQESEAQKFFHEIELSPFGEQRLPYTQQHVALHFRDSFFKKFPKASKAKVRKEVRMEKVMDTLINIWVTPNGTWEKCDGKVVAKTVNHDGTAAFDIEYDDGAFVSALAGKYLEEIEGGEVEVGSKIKGPHVALLATTFMVSTVHEEGKAAIDDRWAEHAHEWFKKIKSGLSDLSMVGIVAILSTIAGFDAANASHVSCVLEYLQDISSEDIWTVKKYNQTFNEIKELKDLTTTPFMTRIVTEILPRLGAAAPPKRAIKSLLIADLGEALTDLTWASLNNKQNGGDSVIESLESHPEIDEGKIRGIAKNITDTIEKEALNTKEVNEWQEEEQYPEEVLRVPSEGVQSPDTPFEREKLEQLITQAVMRSLKRKPTRRSKIYDEFVAFYIDREVCKSLGKRSAIAPDKLAFEAMEFARQLAIFMSMRGVTKLSRKVRSSLFTEPSPADIYFSDEPLAKAARDAGPLRISGSHLTFVHKTVQEHMVADAVTNSLLEAAKSMTLALPEGLDLVSWIVRMLKKPETGREAPPRQHNQRIEIFIKELASSPLAMVALEPEPAVRDFILDRLLESPVLAGAAHCAAILSICGGSRVEKLGLVAENLISIFSGQMPRRKNRTLLHAAALEGDERLLTTVLHVLLVMNQKQSADDGAKITPCGAKREDIQSAWQQNVQRALQERAETNQSAPAEHQNMKAWKPFACPKPGCTKRYTKERECAIHNVLCKKGAIAKNGEEATSILDLADDDGKTALDLAHGQECVAAILSGCMTTETVL